MAGLTKEKIDRIRKLISKGYSLKEVAQKAEASPKTVGKYAGNIAKSKRETLKDKIELYFAIVLEAI
jgi:DNA-binding CsgD family transcriptional regulator